VTTLAAFLTDALSRPRERAFAERRGAPDWRFTSSSRMLERARAIAFALREAGVAPGDRVGLMSENRVDWIAADFGVALAGAVVVPVFATTAFDQLDFIFGDAEVKLVFAETPADAERLRDHCPHVPRVVHFDGAGPDSLETFEAHGAELAAANPGDAAALAGRPDVNSLAVLMYTSGTTGVPKGVMLTHENLLWTVKATFAYALEGEAPLDGAVVLCVLPFAHIYQHSSILGNVLHNADLYVTQPNYFIEDLKVSRPRSIALVPRIFERLLAAVHDGAKTAGGLKATLVPWALRVAREYATAALDRGAAPTALRLQHGIAERLVFAKLRASLGLDRLDFLVSGSAPLHRDIALTFAGMGLPVLEGYGLTETAPSVSFNKRSSIKYGSVGKPIPGVEVKLDSDGEILVRGPNVMAGYYHLAGPQPFTKDGFLRTGDIGHLDSDGYLFITDRKKELIKTSGGKYVAPSRVEAAIRRSPLVGQCFVIGDGHPFPIALVVPNWAAIRAEIGIDAAVSTAAIAARHDVHDFMQREVAAKTADLASFEQIRRIALLPRDLTIEDGDLSPTMKIRRRVVEAKFADVIEAAYAPAAAATQ
jgi:long-chain acyl-CoA synthetase